MNQLTIRPESPADADEITRVTELAFRTAPHSDRTEQLIVLALRRAGALTLSLVAERAGQVVGHVAFSPVQISDGSPHWYGLGPVAVLPEHQSQGMGTALINNGLAALHARGAAGCVVLGEPSYYSRFGFRPCTTLVLDGVPPEYFQAICFDGNIAAGKVAYHAAFEVKEC